MSHRRDYIFSTELWISSVIMAVYCSLTLDAMPVSNTNNTIADKTMEADANQSDIEISVEKIRHVYDLNEDQENSIEKNNKSVSHVGRRVATSDIGWLRFYARYGKDLPDKDKLPSGAGKSDPYMRFVAYDVDGNSYTKDTFTDIDDEDPEWYQVIDFGIGPWRVFEVSVWDDDDATGPDQRLSNTMIVFLPYIGSLSAKNVDLTAYTGFVKFDFHYAKVSEV